MKILHDNKVIQTSMESKRRRLSDDYSQPEGEKWVQFGAIVLTRTDKEQIMLGEKLNDRHVDVAQGL